MDDMEEWLADIGAGTPQTPSAPVASPNLPSVRPTNVAGQYTDLNQILLGHDLKNQLFSQFGLGDYGWSEKAAGESGDYALGTLTPEAQAALQGYSFAWDPSGVRNQGMLTMFDPQGQQAGQYQQMDRSTLDDVREYAGLGLQAANFFAPGLLSGLLGGLGTVGSGAVMGGLGSLVQGADSLEDVLKGAAVGGLGSFATPYIGQAARSASEAVGGGALGEAASRAVSGAGRAALTGQDPLAAALSGAADPLASAAVAPLGLPSAVSPILSRGLAEAVRGGNVENAVLREALRALQAPSGNLEQDFVVAQRPEGAVIEDTAGNRGYFTPQGQWQPVADIGRAPTNAAGRAPATRPAAQAAVQPSQDIAALLALMSPTASAPTRGTDNLFDISGVPTVEEIFGIPGEGYV